MTLLSAKTVRYKKHLIYFAFSFFLAQFLHMLMFLGSILCGSPLELVILNNNCLLSIHTRMISILSIPLLLYSVWECIYSCEKGLHFCFKNFCIPKLPGSQPSEEGHDRHEMALQLLSVCTLGRHGETCFITAVLL